MYICTYFLTFKVLLKILFFYNLFTEGAVMSNNEAFYYKKLESKDDMLLFLIKAHWPTVNYTALQCCVAT